MEEEKTRSEPLKQVNREGKERTSKSQDRVLRDVGRRLPLDLELGSVLVVVRNQEEEREGMKGGKGVDTDIDE